MLCSLSTGDSVKASWLCILCCARLACPSPTPALEPRSHERVVAACRRSANPMFLLGLFYSFWDLRCTFWDLCSRLLTVVVICSDLCMRFQLQVPCNLCWCFFLDLRYPSLQVTSMILNERCLAACWWVGTGQMNFACLTRCRANKWMPRNVEPLAQQHVQRKWLPSFCRKVGHYKVYYLLSLGFAVHT